MTLRRLLHESGVVANDLVDPGSRNLHSMTIDSRQARAGALFVCMPGMTRESESFLDDAVANGAVAALVHSSDGMERAKQLGLDVALVSPMSQSFNDAIWRLCDVFFDHPTREMKVIGVTGTNGKTTVAWLLRDMLSAAGWHAAYLGTLGFHLPESSRELANTTPFTVELYNLLAEARDAGVEALAMEVSSHALAEQRADGVEFDVAIFTNLTQDHLDFHGTMDAYAAAKYRLFTELPGLSRKPFTAVLNTDDPVGKRWRDELVAQGTNVLSYGSEPANLVPAFASIALASVEFSLAGHRSEHTTSLMKAPLGGSYNAMNLVSASAGMLALGFDAPSLEAALPKVHPVPGRFEPVPNESGVTVLVDYAHTPDALEKLLEAVRALATQRIITVFGCGGDRDTTKRPLMARAASLRSDFTVITSDNPRTEDPKAILRQVETGIETGRPFVSIEGRMEAVAHAIRLAEPGDVVVIAGKGHENYQIIGREKLPMDDRDLAQAALRQK